MSGRNPARLWRRPSRISGPRWPWRIRTSPAASIGRVVRRPGSLNARLPPTRSSGQRLGDGGGAGRRSPRAHVRQMLGTLVEAGIGEEIERDLDINGILAAAHRADGAQL